MTSAPADPSNGATLDGMERSRALRRLLFRFGFVYFLIYSHTFPIWLLPTPSGVAEILGYEAKWIEQTKVIDEALDDYGTWYVRQERAVVDATAEHLFGIERVLDRPYGSGDPAYSYILLMWQVLAVGLIAALWSYFASGRGNYDRLGAWLVIGLRLWVATAMLSYGLSKVLPTQFPAWIKLDRLLAPWGDSSPMSVIWTTMRSSEAYTIFGGAGEVVGGLLLLFRRTATVGALITAGVMANVVAMNFCFDVPVKLYSSHLLLGGVAVAAPDLRRLYAVLIQNRETAPRDMRFPHLPVTGSIFKVLSIAIFVVPGIERRVKSIEEDKNLPAHYGIWDVAEFEVDGEIQLPLATDVGFWKVLTIDRNDRCSIYRMDGTRMSQSLKYGDDGELQLDTKSDWEVAVSGDEMTLTGHFAWRFLADLGDKKSTLKQENREPQHRVTLRRVGAPPPDAEVQPEDWIGTWSTERVEVLGDLYLPRLKQAPSSFTELEFVEDGTLRVTLPTGRVDTFGWKRTDDQRLTLSFTTASTFEVKREGEAMEFEGSYRGHDLRVALKQRDLQEFLLLRRGFHWVNPIPLNRF